MLTDVRSCRVAWAGNVAFDPTDLATDSVDGTLRNWTLPEATIRALPADGVVIVAEMAPTFVYRCCGHFRPGTLPLRLAYADVQLMWEGQIASNVPLYLIEVQVLGRDVDVRGFFGSLHPSEATLAAAQDELDRLVIPSASPTAAPSNGDRPGS